METISSAHVDEIGKSWDKTASNAVNEKLQSSYEL